MLFEFEREYVIRFRTPLGSYTSDELVLNKNEVKREIAHQIHDYIRDEFEKVIKERTMDLEAQVDILDNEITELQNELAVYEEDND